MSLAAVAASTSSSAAARAAGTFTKHTYTSSYAPTPRDYWVYVPAGKPRAPRPVVVFLHGCNETALEGAKASHFNALADKRGFVVVYPQQRINASADGSQAPPGDGNGVGCWNWFMPENQVRDAGEPGIIAGITREVIKDQRADARRVFVEGVSAGADMSVILSATYPDIYAASAVLAGCSYATCGDGSGQLAYQAMGSRARAVPMLVENGTLDTLNAFGLAAGLAYSWVGVGDLADDGQLNGSVSRNPSSTEFHGFTQIPSPGSGDACVHNNSLTCPGGVIGYKDSYPYTVTRWNDANGCDLVELWAIHGMEHAHPDAPGDGPYTDPLGPDITAASYDFFSSHPMGSTCKH